MMVRYQQAVCRITIASTILSPIWGCTDNSAPTSVAPPVATVSPPTNTASASPNTTTKSQLADDLESYGGASMGFNKPVNNWEEAIAETPHPSIKEALARLRDAKCQVAWGVSLVGRPPVIDGVQIRLEEFIVAVTPEVEKNGGEVLTLTGGAVKMTAEEIQQRLSKQWPSRRPTEPTPKE